MPRRVILLLALLCGLVTLVIYGRALALPLYMDDVIFARYIDPLTLPEIFYRVDIVPYYRPLSLVPWELLHGLTGRYDRLWMHAFNLIVHAANGVLVGRLTWRIAQPRRSVAVRVQAPALRMAVTAGLIYLLFPFSYQAVPWAAALGHLLAAFGTLAAMNAWEDWLAREKTGSSADVAALAAPSRPRLSYLGVWLGVAAAVFSHENGAASVLLLCLLVALHRGRARAALPVLVPAFAIVAVFALVWLALPKERDALALNTGDVAANAAYFVQGLGFPLAQFGGLLTRWSAAPGAVAAVGLSAAAVGAAAWLALRDPYAAAQRRVFGLGLAWYAVAISVPAVLLPARYVIDGPRLMLLASIGAALLWAAAIQGLSGAQPATPRHGNSGLRIRPLAGLALAGFIVMSSADFLAQRTALHDTIAPIYDRMFAQDGRSAYINLPAWLAYDQTTYALGSEGVTYMTDYIGLADLVLINTGEWRDVMASPAQDIRDPVPDHYWEALDYGSAAGAVISSALADGGAAYALQWVGGAWRWACADRLSMEANIPSPCLSRSWPVDSAEGEPAAFANDIALMPVAARAEGQSLAVEVGWLVSQPDAVTTFVHLVCQGEDVPVTQADGSPLRGLLPLAAMARGDVWRERRYLDVPDARQLSDCAVRIGLYNPETGARIPLVDGGEWIEMPIE
jgi:hypothetical protein